MAGLGQALTLVSLLWQACTQNPHNMQQCLTNHDQWLWPEVQRGWDLYTGREVPYGSQEWDKRYQMTRYGWSDDLS